MKRNIYPVLVGVMVVAATALFAACEPQPVQQVAAEGEPLLFPEEVRKSGPDDHGVVCYTFRHRGDVISCVKVQ